MSLLSLLGISDALAATGTAAPQSPAGGLLSMLPMLIIIVAVFYFLFIRPQAKRNREQRGMLDKLTIGDELVTTAGIYGRLTKIEDNLITLTIAPNVNVVFQKQAIAGVLPKGTLDTLNK